MRWFRRRSGIPDRLRRNGSVGSPVSDTPVLTLEQVVSPSSLFLNKGEQIVNTTQYDEIAEAGSTLSRDSHLSETLDIFNGKLKPKLSKELDEWLSFSTRSNREMRASSAASSLWDDDLDDETSSTFSDTSDSTTYSMKLRKPASERTKMFSPGDYSLRRRKVEANSSDLSTIRELANEFLCVSVGCVLLIFVAYVGHYLARHGVISHVNITGF